MVTRQSVIKAISFDVDGTLLDYEKALQNGLIAVRDEIIHASDLDPESLSIADMMSIRNQVTAEHKEWSLEEIRILGFSRILEHTGIRDRAMAARLNALYMEYRYGRIRSFADVLPSLRLLEQRYTLGLISNGNSYAGDCGLSGRFQFEVYSRDHGIEKPDLRLFRLALLSAGCAASELLHVGDSLIDDVAGAQQAGIRAIWLSRNGTVNQTKVQADFVISSLAELVAICGSES